MSHDEVQDARSPGATRLQSAARLRELSQLPGRVISRTRCFAALVAHSSSVRRALLTRVLAATLCVGLALWAGRATSDAAEHPRLVGATGDRSDSASRHPTRTRGQELRHDHRDPSTFADTSECAPRAASGSHYHRDDPGRGATGRARLTDDDGPMAPAGTTAIHLELAVGAPSLQQRDHVDILGPRSEPQPTDAIPRSMPYDPADGQVAVISRAAVVLRHPPRTIRPSRSRSTTQMWRRWRVLPSPEASRLCDGPRDQVPVIRYPKPRLRR